MMTFEDTMGQPLTPIIPRDAREAALIAAYLTPRENNYYTTSHSLSSEYFPLPEGVFIADYHYTYEWTATHALDGGRRGLVIVTYDEYADRLQTWWSEATDDGIAGIDMTQPIRMNTLPAVVFMDRVLAKMEERDAQPC